MLRQLGLAVLRRGGDYRPDSSSDCPIQELRVRAQVPRGVEPAGCRRDELLERKVEDSTYEVS